MGLGEFLTEDVVFSSAGELLSVGTWEYKPLFSLDIPQKMNVRFTVHSSPPPSTLQLIFSPPRACGLGACHVM